MAVQGHRRRDRRRAQSLGAWMAPSHAGGRTMSHHMTVAGIGIAVALAVSLSGCAGRARVSTKSMCEAHGGTYATQTKQCTYPAQPATRSAAQICQMQGGQLDPISDECAINDRSK